MAALFACYIQIKLFHNSNRRETPLQIIFNFDSQPKFRRFRFNHDRFYRLENSKLKFNSKKPSLGATLQQTFEKKNKSVNIGALHRIGGSNTKVSHCYSKYRLPSWKRNRFTV